MGLPINRTAKNVLDVNLNAGVVASPQAQKNNNNVIYDYVDGLNNEINANKTKLDGISSGANKVEPSTNGKIKIDGVDTTVYTHPTGDGNQHVPATGTTNNKKVLKAGSTAGSAAWGDVDHADLLNKGANTHAQIDSHISNQDIHIMASERTSWNAKETPAGAQAKADAAAAAGIGAATNVQENLDTHTGNASIHTTQSEKNKLAGIQSGAEVNQNAFSKVKVAGQPDIDADSKTDTLTLESGIGITLTNDPVSKKTRITATGEAAPAPHASTHEIGGNDYLSPASIGAETPAGAQDKADAAAGAVQASLNNHIKDYVRQPGYGTASGTDAKTITLSPAPAALVEGFAISFKNSAANTGAVTLNVNGLGAKPVLKSNGTALASGNLKAGSIYTVRYDGANFILQGEGGSGNAQPGDVLSGKTFTNDVGEQTGTMPNRTGHVTGQSISRSGTTLRIRPQQGHYPGDAGNSVQWNEPNLLAQYIQEGTELFGLVGTLSPMRSASGTATSSSNTFQFFNYNNSPLHVWKLVVLGLSFKPKFIFIRRKSNYLYTIYAEGLDFSNINPCPIILGTSATQASPFQLGGNAIVTNDSFELPVNMQNGQFDWLAIG